MNGQSRVDFPDNFLYRPPHLIPLPIVDQHRVIMDHQMDIQFRQGITLNVIDDVMADQRIFLCAELRMNGSKALTGTIIMDQQVILLRELRPKRG